MDTRLKFLCLQLISGLFKTRNKNHCAAKEKNITFLHFNFWGCNTDLKFALQNILYGEIIAYL